MLKTYSLKLMAFLCLFILGTYNVNSQIIDVRDITTLDDLQLVECGKADTLTFVVRAVTGTVYNVKITDSLPNGINCIKILPHPKFTAWDISNPQKPRFNLDSLTYAVTDTFKILVKANCGAGSSQSSYFQHFKIAHDKGIKEAKGNNFISGIKSSVLQLIGLANNNINNGIVGNTYIRKWKIVNTGIKSELDSFYFSDILQSGTQFVSLKIDGVTKSPLITGDTIRQAIVKKLRDISKYPNDTLLVEVEFKITQCTNPSEYSITSAFWGCGGQLYCGIATEKPAVQIANDLPILVKKLHKKKISCPGGFDTLTYVLINQGKGKASNIVFDVVTGYSIRVSDYANRSSYFDSSNLVYKIGANGSYQGVIKNNIYTSVYNKSIWPDNNPVYRMNIGFPLLNPGDTIFFDVLAYRPCKGNYACGNYFSNYIHSEVLYQNICGTSDYIIARKNDHGEASRGSSTLIGPSDMVNGDTGSFSMSFGSNSYTNYNSDKNGMLRLDIKFPPGFKWDGDTSSLELTSVAHTKTDKPDSIYYDEATGLLQVFYFYNKTGDWNTTNSRQRATINPKFVLDCSVPGAGANETISFSSYDLRQGNCPECWEQFTCNTTFTSNIHCPGPCPRGGVSPYASSIRRTTLGLPDNNRDGLPDTSGTLDVSKIDIKKMVAADTFTHEYRFKISKGSQSPSSFTHGYGESQFPSPVGKYMDALYATMTIKDSSTNSEFTITNIPFTVSNTGNQRTIKWDYSPTATGIIGFPSGYEFDKDDSVIFNAYYQFNKDGINYGSDLTGALINDFFVSPYANPSNDTAKYRCDLYNAEFETVSNYYTVYNPDVVEVKGCDGFTAVYRTYLSIGQCCSNYHTSEHFPYEYRAFGITDSIVVKIPDGFTIDSANIVFYHGAQTGTSRYYRKYTVNPDRVSSTEYMYNQAQFYTTHGGDIPPSDGGFVNYLYVYYKPTCSTPNNVPIYRRSDNYMGHVNTWKNRSNIKAGTNGWNHYINYGSGTTTFRGPQIALTNVGATSKYGDEKTIYWDAKVQETSNNSNADNVWIAGKSRSGLIKIDSIYNLTDNVLLTKTNDIFKIGTVTKGGGIKNLRIFATYLNCYLDTLDLFSGWNCDSYPDSLSASPCISDSIKTYLETRFPELQARFISKPARNSTNTGAELSLCDTFQYIINVSNRKEAKAYELEFDLFTAEGIRPVLDSIFITYPAGSNNEYNVTAAQVNPKTFRINISQQIDTLLKFGLSKFSEGTPSNRTNEYDLRCKFTTSCGFTSGSRDQFIARYKSGCENQIVNKAQFDPLFLKSSPNPKFQYTYMALDGKSVKGCSDTTVLKAFFKNFELSPTSKDDLFRIVLPVGVKYINNSSTPIRNPLYPLEPALTNTLDAQNRVCQLLTWSLDTMVPKLDSAVFEFSVKGIKELNICGKQPLSCQSVTKYTDTCIVDNEPCAVFVENDTFYSYLDIERADIKIDSGSYRVTRDTVYHRDDSTIVNLVVKNYGKFKGFPEIHYFQDNNLDGFYNSGDVIISIDTIGEVEKDSSKQVSKIISSKWGTAACPIAARLVTDCDCKGDTTYNNSLPCTFVKLPVEFINFRANLLNNEISKLTWQTASEINNHYFAIYRRFETENSFNYVGMVEGAGFSNSLQNYSYLDKIDNYDNGIVYYQIKQVDYDENFTFSNIRIVTLDRDVQFDEIVVYPNPSKDKINFKLDSKYIGVKFRIVNSIGQEYYKSTTSKNNSILIDSFTKGVYFIEIEGNSVPLKFVKN